ncbi:MAG TPA: DUF6191 domain-containing protein [Streptosporangiaceae bacterium]|nr:DUF6191 domain-containing protein [Streptosporangiaceae bacterium]
MKSPFRRRRRRRSGARQARPAQTEAQQPEVVDWPKDGVGRSLMSTLRGDAETGTGFGAGIFEDLHAMFSGGKRIQIEEQEAEKMRRHDDHQQAGNPNRPDLDSGVIRIRRSSFEKE